MAVVAVYTLPWSVPWPGMGSGSLTVFANDAGNRAIDRVEVDNSRCAVRVRVRVRDQDEQWNQTLLFSRVYEPFQALDAIPVPGNVRWREGTKGPTPIASKYIVNIGYELP